MPIMLGAAGFVLQYTRGINNPFVAGGTCTTVLQ